MKYCFIVTSAINSSHTKMRENTHMDLYNPEVRFNDTLETLKSIKDRIDCDIYIVESSEVPLSEDKIEALKEYAKVYQYSSDLSNKVYKNVKSIGKLQNSIETLSLLDFLQCNREILSEYERFFKITGRYKLSDNFKLDKHNNKFVKDKFLFLKPDHKHNYVQCRLYSFDSSLVEYHIELFKKFLSHMTEVGNNTANFAAMEECYYKFLDKDKVMYANIIGVEGYIAHRGEYIKE